MESSLLPLAIFTLTYLVIAAGKFPALRLDRAGAALVGGVAMVIVGAVNERQALNAVDFPTLALLLGMMIVVANLRLSGAFAMAARMVLLRARSGFELLALTIAGCGVLAAFFINDVVCLALAPLLIESARLLDASPEPFLLALATASNIGSVATVTGNPQNMIVAGYARLGYSAFAAKLTPIAMAGLVIDYVIIALLYRRQLGRVQPELRYGNAAPAAEKVVAGLLVPDWRKTLATQVTVRLGERVLSAPQRFRAWKKCGLASLTDGIRRHLLLGASVSLLVKNPLERHGVYWPTEKRASSGCGVRSLYGRSSGTRLTARELNHYVRQQGQQTACGRLAATEPLWRLDPI
jgi:citrate transporter